MATITFSYESYWDNDVKLFTRALQIAPRNPDAAEYLASVYINTHQPEKAEAIARALINDPDLSAQGWYILGTVQSISYEDYDSARESFQQSRELFRHQNFLSNMGLASVDMKLGKEEEAVAILREELKTYPRVPYIQGQLAIALEHKCGFHEATRDTELERQRQ
jgi:tetratricopeptide (TPR) repeat protein